MGRHFLLIRGFLPAAHNVTVTLTVLDMVKQAAVKESRDGGDGSNIVLVFPSLDEGDQPGRVQM